MKNVIFLRFPLSFSYAPYIRNTITAVGLISVILSLLDKFFSCKLRVGTYIEINSALLEKTTKIYTYLFFTNLYITVQIEAAKISESMERNY